MVLDELTSAANAFNIFSQQDLTVNSPATTLRILMFMEEQLQITMVYGILIGAAVALLVIAVVIFFVYKKLKQRYLQRQDVPRYRFRKRDKVMFYGRKIMRKMSQSTSALVENATTSTQRSRLRKRQKVLNLAKK